MALPATSVLIWRALSCKCPVCGKGEVFASHFQMNRNCPACRVEFWSDPGESLGAMYIDYAVAVPVFLAAWMILDWTVTLSDFAQFVIVSILSVAGILIFYPISRSAWTVLVYVSGGIERPPLRVVRGGRN
jgi:uncharacterized protein (DUF983 family)